MNVQYLDFKGYGARGRDGRKPLAFPPGESII